jgi:hypothetical protein
LRHALARDPGRAPPFDTVDGAWRALRKAAGDFGQITEFLVSEFQITPFGRYRCHASPSQLCMPSLLWKRFNGAYPSVQYARGLRLPEIVNL